MDQQAIRSQIPATGNVVYMNTGWSGPSPTSVVEGHLAAAAGGERTWGRPAPACWRAAGECVKSCGSRWPPFLNVSTEELTLTQNTTEGQNLVINGLAWQQGDEVITFSLEHNSVLAPCYYLERRHGTVTKVLPLEPDEDHDSIVSKVEAAITPRTKLLFMSHVQFKIGAAHAGGTASRGDAAARGADAARRRAGGGPRAA